MNIDDMIVEARVKHEEYQRQLKEEKIRIAHPPDLMCIYAPDMNNGLIYCIEKYDKTLTCEICMRVGSYYMANEKYKEGCCREHMTTRNKDKNSHFTHILELPRDHNYPDAEEVPRV